MPILNVKVSAAPDAALSARIAATLTELTAQILLKDAGLTSVAVTHQAPEHWFIGGQSLAQLGKSSFYLGYGGLTQQYRAVKKIL